MNLKNYTTSVHWAKSIGEIEGLLSQMGATAIMKEYRGDGRVSSIAFKINVMGQDMAFKLPAETEKAYAVLLENKSVSRRNPIEGRNQAERVVWRIIKDWLAAQLSLMQIGQAKAEQIFLPYMWNGKETVYDLLAKRGFQVSLPKAKDEVEYDEDGNQVDKK